MRGKGGPDRGGEGTHGSQPGFDSFQIGSYSEGVGPKIAITTGTSEGWLRGGCYLCPYEQAVRHSGGEPEPIGPDTRARIELCHGLLAPGGPDVHPANYPRRPGDEGLADEEVIEKYSIKTDPARDEYELSVIRRALEFRMPILGICRGIQALNVAMGGRLIEDIPLVLGTQIPHSNADHSPAMHEVEIRPGSLLHRLIGDRHIEVNSYHHQGLTEAELAPGLVATAFSADGLVEAVESRDGSFVLAVQWHPERTNDDSVYQRCKVLFDALVRAASQAPDIATLTRELETQP